MAKNLLTALPYFGNIAFYRLLLQYDDIYVEQFENFVKSSFRNRCEIAGPNGKQTLSIPVKGGKGIRKLYKEVKVASEHDWLKNHWNSLEAAYRRSPYFEYYEDELSAVFHAEYDSLFEFNKALFLFLNELLGIQLNIHYTKSYEKEREDCVDERMFLKRKSIETLLPSVKYHQVFEEKNGFIPNMSILDLLFNEGPNSSSFLDV